MTTTHEDSEVQEDISTPTYSEIASMFNTTTSLSPAGTYSQSMYAMPQINFQRFQQRNVNEPIIIQPATVQAHPSGLEHLAMTDELFIYQVLDTLKLVTGISSRNKYSIGNRIGQCIYYAVEESDCCSRNCCFSRGSFRIKIMDNYGNIVVNLFHPLAWECCCFTCCLQTMEVRLPSGLILGIIEEQWGICRKLAIKNANGDIIFYIESPFSSKLSCGKDIHFHILTRDRNILIGKITRKWSDSVQELCTTNSNFSISFPADLDVHMKASILGACFLIAAMYY